jgi:hypothetical protein
MIRILKNPTNKSIELSYDNKLTIFKAGETKPVEDYVAKLALEFNNTPLVDITDTPLEEKVIPGASSEVIEPNLNFELASMKLPQLLKLAKSKGLKIKFGMKKVEVISLILNG